MGILAFLVTGSLHLQPLPPTISAGDVLVFESIIACSSEQDMRTLAEEVRSGRDGKALFLKLPGCDTVSFAGVRFLRILNTAPFRVRPEDPWLLAAEVRAPDGKRFFVALPRSLVSPAAD